MYFFLYDIEKLEIISYIWVKNRQGLRAWNLQRKKIVCKFSLIFRSSLDKNRSVAPENRYLISLYIEILIRWLAYYFNFKQESSDWLLFKIKKAAKIYFSHQKIFLCSKYLILLYGARKISHRHENSKRKHKLNFSVENETKLLYLWDLLLFCKKDGPVSLQPKLENWI